MPGRSIYDADVVVVDVEATGLSFRRDRLVEVGLVRGRNGVILDRFSSLVQPGRPMGATEVHGITEEMVAEAPRAGVVLRAVLPRLDGAVLVGHRATVDLRFLQAEAARYGMVIPNVPLLDTVEISRRFPVESRQLAALCAWFGVPMQGQHRALVDAEATWELFWHMVRALDAAGRPVTVADLQARTPLMEAESRLRMLEVLELAVHEGQRVTIRYESGGPGGALSQREITPLRVTRREVRAFCHLRDAERTFRVERMRLLEPGDLGWVTERASASPG